MATDHVESLEQARKTLVARRRAMAGSLATAKEQIESEAERLMKIQGAIDAIDRALDDERKPRPGVKIVVTPRDEGNPPGHEPALPESRDLPMVFPGPLSGKI